MKDTNRLVRGVCLAAAAVSLPAAVLGAGAYVGSQDVGTNHVSEATTETGLVSVGPEGTLYKTGSGEWSVPRGAFGALSRQDIVVKNGGLTIDLDDASPKAAACPIEIIGAKALFWFDASAFATKPGLFITHEADGKVYVDRMHDIRETDTEDRQRPVAVATHRFRYVKEGMDEGVYANTAKRDDESKVPSPELVTCDGQPALYFGGVGSGRCMDVLRQGKTTLVSPGDVRHVIMVQNVKAGSGPAFSPTFRGYGCWTGTAASSLNSSMLHTDVGAQILGHRLFVNGERKDGFVDKPTLGLSLWECELTSTAGDVTRLFYNGDCQDGSACKIAPGDDGSRATVVQEGGGDYVYEMICFTNALTGVERQKVVEYLARKWMTPELGELKVAGAAGTTVTLAGTAVTTNRFPRSSQATLATAGSGTVVFAHDSLDEIDVPVAGLRLADGTTALAQRPVPIEMAAGKSVTATDGETATEYAQATLGGGAADLFEKNGRAALLVREVPADVKRIAVNRGKIVFHPRTADGSLVGPKGDGVLVPIRNASFEERAAGHESLWGVSLGANAAYCGWQNMNERTAGYFYNVDTWGLDEPGRDNATRRTWGLTARPHDGGGAFFFQRDIGIRTVDAVQFEEGWYEMEYWTNTRGSETGGLLDVLLIDPSTLAETKVSRSLQKYTAAMGFGPVRFRFRVTASGPRYLAFHMPYGDGDVVSNVTVLDDIRLWRIAAPADATEWPVPNGDFNDVEAAKGSCTQSSAFSPKNVWHPAWTLTQPAGTAESATGDQLGVGIGDQLNSKLGATACYNDSRYPYRSPQLVFLNNGASAETTFTPPAGTWYLKADLAENGAGPDGKVTATVTPAGGAAVTLGAIDPNVKVMKTFRFTGKSFTVDGQTPVTLTLSYAVSSGSTTAGSMKHVALYVDDLRLTQRTSDAPGAEIKRWGDILWSSDGWPSIPDPVTGETGGTVQYKDYPSYGCDPIGGNGGNILMHQSGKCTDYDFGRPGTYRLSFYLNRLSGNLAVSPVRAWIAQGGVTNQLAVEKCGTVWQREHSCVFRIPEGDSYVYTIGFSGMGVSGEKDEEGHSYYAAVLDNVGVAPVSSGELVDKDDLIGEDVRIDIAENAMIDLNFVGTNKIGRLKLGRRFVHGVVSSKTHPEYISGPGALELGRPGCVIIFR